MFLCTASNILVANHADGKVIKITGIPFQLNTFYTQKMFYHEKYDATN
jgi:hypothetical protein